MIFFGKSWSEITHLHLFLSFYCSIKWFFYKNLGFILFFVLSLSYYDVWFVIRLLQRGVFRRLVVTFYLCGCDSNKQSRFVQLKISYYDYQYVEDHWSLRYSNNYIIKFVGFIQIYAINMDIVFIF